MNNAIKPLSSTQMAIDHENEIVDIFKWANGRRSKSSGASFHDPVDVTTDVTVTECEATQNKSYSLKLTFWEEIVKKQHSGKIPTLAVRFLERDKQKSTDLMIIDAAELSLMFEELEYYRNEAIKRA
jgi:hypothetical protein